MKRRSVLKMLGAVLIGTGFAPLVSLGKRFRGEVRDVRAWNRKLTDQEIKKVAEGDLKLMSGAFTISGWVDPKTGRITATSLKRRELKEEDPWFHQSFSYPSHPPGRCCERDHDGD
jgi:hypothetical protein